MKPSTTTSPDVGPAELRPLLGDLEARSRVRLTALLQEVRVEANAPLLVQGQQNDRLWFVATGTVAIERTAADGHSEVLATLAAPAIFGTTTFYRPDTPASATIRAVESLHLWTLDRESDDQLRRDDPRTAEDLNRAIIRILSERFDLLDGRLAKLMTQPEPSNHAQPVRSELAAFRTRLFEEPGI